MTEMQFILFVYILPVLCGLAIGVAFWKFKKSYLLTGMLLASCIIWWCIISNVNIHGSEGPGMIFWMYTHLVLSFSFVNLIKFVVREIKSRS